MVSRLVTCIFAGSVASSLTKGTGKEVVIEKTKELSDRIIGASEKHIVQSALDYTMARAAVVSIFVALWILPTYKQCMLIEIYTLHYLRVVL